MSAYQRMNIAGLGLTVSLTLMAGCISGADVYPGEDAATGTGGHGGGGGQGGMVGASGSGGASGGPGAGGLSDAGPDCGDGRVTPPEVCDPGNNASSKECVAECACGSTLVDSIAFVEIITIATTTTTTSCYVLSMNATNWLDARDQCLSAGMDLASISTPEERDSVALHIDTLPLSTGESRYWIGGNDISSDGSFQWINGEPWANANLGPLWGPGEPNNYNGEDCVELYKHDNGYRFNDNDCGVQLRFLCEDRREEIYKERESP